MNPEQRKRRIEELNLQLASADLMISTHLASVKTQLKARLILPIHTEIIDLKKNCDHSDVTTGYWLDRCAICGHIFAD
jgi:hypothetical protein